MTDDEVKEIEKKYAELEAYYGDSLANFEHHPRQFANQVRLYKYYQTIQTDAEAVADPSENVVDFTQDS